MALAELFPLAAGIVVLGVAWKVHKNRKRKGQSMEVDGMWTKRWKGTFR